MKCPQCSRETTFTADPNGTHASCPRCKYKTQLVNSGLRPVPLSKPSEASTAQPADDTQQEPMECFADLVKMTAESTTPDGNFLVRNRVHIVLTVWGLAFSSLAALCYVKFVNRPLPPNANVVAAADQHGTENSKSANLGPVSKPQPVSKPHSISLQPTSGSVAKPEKLPLIEITKAVNPIRTAPQPSKRKRMTITDWNHLSSDKKLSLSATLCEAFPKYDIAGLELFAALGPTIVQDNDLVLKNYAVTKLREMTTKPVLDLLVNQSAESKPFPVGKPRVIKVVWQSEDEAMVATIRSAKTSEVEQLLTLRGSSGERSVLLQPGGYYFDISTTAATDISVYRNSQHLTNCESSE